MVDAVKPPPPNNRSSLGTNGWCLSSADGMASSEEVRIISSLDETNLSGFGLFLLLLAKSIRRDSRVVWSASADGRIVGITLKIKLKRNQRIGDSNSFEENKKKIFFFMNESF